MAVNALVQADLKGTGKFKGPTKAMRVPCHLLPQIQTLISQEIMCNSGADTSVLEFKKPVQAPHLIPLFQDKVAAGSPIPAEDVVEDKIDLSTYLVQHPESTFLVRAQGQSMIGAGIFQDDLLIVDNKITPQSGHIIIALIDTEVTVKRLQIKDKKITLLPENPDYQPIIITSAITFSISGVVKHVIHSLT